MANGSKHLKLDKFERNGARLLHIDSIKTADTTTGEIISEVPLGFLIASKQGTPEPYDLIGFMQRAVQDWKDLLKKHGFKT